MKSPPAQLQEAMRFFHALPDLAARGELRTADAAGLDLPALAALAQRFGYTLEADALAEAFRIRMLSRLVARHKGTS